MWMTILYAAGASLPLLAGAIVGVRWQPPQRLVASVLAFAAGALIVSASFELFEPAYEGGGAWRLTQQHSQRGAARRGVRQQLPGGPGRRAEHAGPRPQSKVRHRSVGR